MIRTIALALTVSAFVVFAAGVADAGKAKNQMVKGTIKSVDTSKDLLIINQKLKNEVVDRELSITPDTEFVVKINGQEKTAAGSQGLKLLEGQEGASVNIKCDKDVNVLKVTVKGKK